MTTLLTEATMTFRNLPPNDNTNRCQSLLLIKDKRYLRCVLNLKHGKNHWFEFPDGRQVVFINNHDEKHLEDPYTKVHIPWREEE